MFIQNFDQKHLVEKIEKTMQRKNVVAMMVNWSFIMELRLDWTIYFFLFLPSERLDKGPNIKT